jgi:hypothetical protein
MVQEFAAGERIGVSVPTHQGQPECVFQHRRRREWPLSGRISGFSETLLWNRRSLSSPSLWCERCTLGTLWRGVAMVEYRFRNLQALS